MLRLHFAHGGGIFLSHKVEVAVNASDGVVERCDVARGGVDGVLNGVDGIVVDLNLGLNEVELVELLVEFGRVVKFRLWDKSLKLLKKRCEENYYWES